MKQNIREYTMRDKVFTVINERLKPVIVIGICYNSKKDPFDITYTVSDGVLEHKRKETQLFKTKEDFLNDPNT